jgi:argininosuccinate lyase
MPERKPSAPRHPVWAHSKVAQSDLRDKIVAFCAGRDVTAVPPCDQSLITEDLATNEASAVALAKASILTKEESARAAQGLIQLRELVEKGDFHLDPDLEDVHINIEQALFQLAGKVAGKLHSGRSRNDQVACDIRQFQRNRILAHLEELASTVATFLEQAEKEKNTIMPGFSHHRRAFITTYGHLLASYAEAWLRDIERGLGLFARINRCPLGAAAGFGTSWPLDRALLADLLGFEGLIENSLDAVTSRLEAEADVASWLALWMMHCSSLAQDLILFSMEEFRWIHLSDIATTGSSIMPQKRNPDFAEVIKGKTALVQGALASLLTLGKGQPSGYHRDSQYSKQVGQDVWAEVSGIPEVIRIVLTTLEPNRKRMREAVGGGFLEAAEWADAIARESGLPFREAYSAIGLAVDRARSKGHLTREGANAALAGCGIKFRVKPDLAKRLGSPEFLLAARVTQGSPNPDKVSDHVGRLEKELETVRKQISSMARHLKAKDKARREEIRRMAGMT